MPLYDYRCTECGHRFELLRSISERDTAVCEKCGGKLERIALWFECKGTSKSDKVTKYATFGLFLFVAIPLPGTGAWMGALIASLLNMRFKNAFISILLGILCAGLIMSLACYGIISGLEFLF